MKRKKRWILLVLVLLLIAGWFKLFYKTYSNNSVPANADLVLALDVKRIINTAIWQLITTPSQWDFSSSKPTTDEPAWDDMVKLPDYAFLFHPATQSMDAWYCVLEINELKEFERGLQQYQFKQTGNRYTSERLGIELIKTGKRLLAGKLIKDHPDWIEAVAEQLFNKQQFIAKEQLKLHADAASHASMQFLSDTWLKAGQLITANYSKDRISIRATMAAANDNRLSNTAFTYCDTSLLSLAWVQPLPSLQQYVPTAMRNRISQALNLDMDSLMVPGNKQYVLDVSGIRARVDSAISYTYDDDFNPVQTVVANNVEEPAFNFRANGSGVQGVYNYFERSGKFNSVAEGNWFTPVPYVKSYCRMNGSNELAIVSGNYSPTHAGANVEALFFGRLLLSKIPPSLVKYLPDAPVKALGNIEAIELLVKRDGPKILFDCTLRKKANDLPVVAW